MLKRITLLLSLFMTFALASSAIAQTPTPQDPVEALNQIDTDVTLYGRSYVEGSMGTLAAGSDQTRMAIIQAYVLDDADVAAEARPYIEQLMKENLEPIIGQELQTEEVDDLGDAATLSSAVEGEGGQAASLSLYIVQQDEVVFISASANLGGESEPTARDLMEFMLEGEPGDVGTVEFNADGTSTGGYFDVFPTAEENDDILQGLIGTEDMLEETT